MKGRLLKYPSLNSQKVPLLSLLFRFGRVEDIFSIQAFRKLMARLLYLSNGKACLPIVTSLLSLSPEFFK